MKENWKVADALLSRRLDQHQCETCEPIADFSQMVRQFLSRDAIVRQVISNCTAVLPSLPRIAEESECQVVLGCILDSVKAAVQGRWSAGASILAFIPTIVAMTSNSVEEVVLTSEESLLLAVLLCLCSVTVLTTRLDQFSATGSERIGERNSRGSSCCGLGGIQDG